MVCSPCGDHTLLYIYGICPVVYFVDWWLIQYIFWGNPRAFFLLSSLPHPLNPNLTFPFLPRGAHLMLGYVVVASLGVGGHCRVEGRSALTRVLGDRSLQDIFLRMLASSGPHGLGEWTAPWHRTGSKGGVCRVTTEGNIAPRRGAREALRRQSSLLSRAWGFHDMNWSTTEVHFWPYWSCLSHSWLYNFYTNWVSS